MTNEEMTPLKKGANFNADVVWAGSAHNAKAQRFLNDASTFWLFRISHG